MNPLFLNEEQKKAYFAQKIEDFKLGLMELSRQTGMTIAPMIRIDGKFLTPSTNYDGHVIEGAVQIVPFEPPQEANVAEKVLEKAEEPKKKPK